MKFVKSDNINRILFTLTGFFYWYLNRSDLGLEQSDHINRMITLTVITLSDFYCICSLFIFEFVYLRLQIDHFSSIYSLYWSFYMRIHCVHANFLGLSHITRSTCTYFFIGWNYTNLNYNSSCPCIFRQIEIKRTTGIWRNKIRNCAQAYDYRSARSTFWMNFSTLIFISFLISKSVWGVWGRPWMTSRP